MPSPPCRSNPGQLNKGRRPCISTEVGWRALMSIDSSRPVSLSSALTFLNHPGLTGHCLLLRLGHAAMVEARRARGIRPIPSVSLSTGATDRYSQTRDVVGNPATRPILCRLFLSLRWSSVGVLGNRGNMGQRSHSVESLKDPALAMVARSHLAVFRDGPTAD